MKQISQYGIQKISTLKYDQLVFIYGFESFGGFLAMVMTDVCCKKL